MRFKNPDSHAIQGLQRSGPFGSPWDLKSVGRDLGMSKFTAGGRVTANSILKMLLKRQVACICAIY